MTDKGCRGETIGPWVLKAKEGGSTEVSLQDCSSVFAGDDFSSFGGLGGITGGYHTPVTLILFTAAQFACFFANWLACSFNLLEFLVLATLLGLPAAANFTALMALKLFLGPVSSSAGVDSPVLLGLVSFLALLGHSGIGEPFLLLVCLVEIALSQMGLKDQYSLLICLGPSLLKLEFLELGDSFAFVPFLIKLPVLVWTEVFSVVLRPALSLVNLLGLRDS